ncbi:ankyrin repeat-containing domain protein [Multifurca ochricompacta]|uniref:Ankyrin repeat-containing domain protein n=1 Tax=Multifurca ochricompacta TaxID=376703 RepID=A0AAD4LYZ7_9AGAM|nr:ankyrin repeat-containing domain protein [Multifurca ochricompacta]
MSISVHSAAQNNQLSLLRSLVLENPASVNAVDSDTRTPLHWASSGGHLDVVTYLLTNGAEVDKADDNGWTPLHIAVSAGQEETVRELVGAGADVNRKNDKGLTPLFVSRVCCLGTFSLVLHDPCRHYAASKSRIEIGRFLISRGADINARDKANQHPLHRAATTGFTGLVTLLLHPPEGSPKTRLNTGDRMGNTPLHLAMESAHGETAALLIEAGADRSRLNLDEQTAEQLEGVGGVEQRRARAYVIDRCGPPPS